MGRILLVGATFAFAACKSPVSDPSNTGPTNPVVAVGFATVSAGNGHVCGLKTDGIADCWGWNSTGQLGTSTTESCGSGNPCSTTPVAVSGGLSFATISAGDGFTCGLPTSGTLYCWGGDSVGELGNGTTTSSAAPVPVVGGLTFAAVSTSFGYYHACGVTTAGKAYCWGQNDSGELGAVTTETCDSVACSTTPIAVSGQLTFSAIAAGGQYSCGINLDSAAYCWGANTIGQLGDGTTTPSQTPVAVAGGLRFSQLSAGYATVCGLTTTGAAYCWGAGNVGQLGTGTTTPSTTPVAVAGGLTFKAVSVGYGADHVCGVTTAGAGYCWGQNALGGIGDGTTSPHLTPEAVSGGLIFSVISVGGLHTSAVTTSHDAYSWGSDGDGQLGNGTSGSGQGEQRPGASSNSALSLVRWQVTPARWYAYRARGVANPGESRCQMQTSAEWAMTIGSKAIRAAALIALGAVGCASNPGPIAKTTATVLDMIQPAVRGSLSRAERR
jgi:alpha-tubulin suppressor-like RCC1 family protein